MAYVLLCLIVRWKSFQVAKEMHELIGSLTSWVYTTSDVMNVVAVAWQIPQNWTIQKDPIPMNPRSRR